MEYVGEFAVDAGICWIGDPCYVLPDDASHADEVRDWSKFCKTIREADTTQFKFKQGHTGLGVVVTTGWGDGQYPVYIERSDEGRVAKVVIEFINEEDDECL